MGVLMTCKKADPVYPFEQELIAEEGLTDRQDSILAALPAASFKSSEILLENGETIEQFLKRTDPGSLNSWGMRVVSQEAARESSINILTPEERKFRFISDMFSEGTRLTDTLLHPFTHNADVPESENPAQFGYSYVWNNDIRTDIRKKAGDCPLNLFGVDCSGLVTRMLQRAGVVIPRYLAYQLAQEYTVNTAFLNTQAYKDFPYHYEDKPPSFISQISQGDLIYFMNDAGSVFHIGVALVPITRTNVYIFQSNGQDVVSGTVDRHGNVVRRGCDVHTPRKGRGPRIIPVNEMIAISDWSNYRILHLAPLTIDPMLLGDWNLVTENITLKQGIQQISIKPITYSDIKFTFLANSTFVVSALDADDPNNPYTCTGTFSLNSKNYKVFLSGCDLYEKTSINATIQSLSLNRLVLVLVLENTGFSQINTLTLTR